MTLANSACVETAGPPFPEATIDGRVIEADRYRVQSPLFTFDAPDGGLYGGPISGAISVSDGIWAPLRSTT